MNYTKRFEGQRVYITYFPFHSGSQKEYCFFKKHPRDTFVEYKTATTGMQVVSWKGLQLFEKLCVDGTMRWFPCPQRGTLGDLNFVNFAWEGPRGKRTLRIDVYTGEHIIMDEE